MWKLSADEQKEKLNRGCVVACILCSSPRYFAEPDFEDEWSFGPIIIPIDDVYVLKQPFETTTDPKSSLSYLSGSDLKNLYSDSNLVFWILSKKLLYPKGLKHIGFLSDIPTLTIFGEFATLVAKGVKNKENESGWSPKRAIGKFHKASKLQCRFCWNGASKVNKCSCAEKNNAAKKRSKSSGDKKN